MKVGIVQLKYSGSKESMREKIVDSIKSLAKSGASLIVLSELHDSNYFCITEDVDKFDLANDFESDLEFYSQLAKENSIVLVSSLFEKRTNGLYHNSAFVFEVDGTLAGKYRKMHIPDDPGFYEKFYFTPGDLGFVPIKTSVGSLGILICWDQWFPEAARLMALRGADILIYPTAIGWFDEDSEDEKQRQLESWITIQRSHAIANALPVVSVNRVGFESDESAVIDGIRFWGNSFVAGSQGEILYQAGIEEESEVIDIDMDRCEEIRRIWPFFRDRRIEFYSKIDSRFLDCE